tara:strand:- start:170 stop:391 length:222 start_codon:yes stop_codon:yes gene_type:complete
MNQEKQVKACPHCKSLATFTFSTSTCVIDCECGVIEVDIMTEDDLGFVVYERFMSQYRVIDRRSVIINLREDL